MANKSGLYLHRMHDLDTALCLQFNRASRYRSLCRLFKVVSRLGDGVFWYGVMLCMVLADPAGGWMPALHMGLAGLTGTLLYKWLKGRTLRPRPYQVHQAILSQADVLDHFSFPSGHTLHAVVFTTVALAYYPGLAALLVTFTVLVGLSRPVLGLHYPSDVLAGAAIGFCIAKLSFLLL